MPAVGLGTGGYGNNGPATLHYPECWSDGQPAPDGKSFFDCSSLVIKVAFAFPAAVPPENSRALRLIGDRGVAPSWWS